MLQNNSRYLSVSAPSVRIAHPWKIDPLEAQVGVNVWSRVAKRKKTLDLNRLDYCLKLGQILVLSRYPYYKKCIIPVIHTTPFLREYEIFLLQGHTMRLIDLPATEEAAIVLFQKHRVIPEGMKCVKCGCDMEIKYFPDREPVWRCPVRGCYGQQAVRVGMLC